jgi:hypothetical protein
MNKGELMLIKFDTSFEIYGILLRKCKLINQKIKSNFLFISKCFTAFYFAFFRVYFRVILVKTERTSFKFMESVED